MERFNPSTFDRVIDGAAAEQREDGRFAGMLEGRNLESIERVGWDGEMGYPVDGLPAPVAGKADRQTLRIALPWPSPAPHAPLYIWLRGETRGRKTSARD